MNACASCRDGLHADCSGRGCACSCEHAELFRGMERLRTRPTCPPAELDKLMREIDAKLERDPEDVDRAGLGCLFVLLAIVGLGTWQAARWWFENIP